MMNAPGIFYMKIYFTGTEKNHTVFHDYRAISISLLSGSP